MKEFKSFVFLVLFLYNLESLASSSSSSDSENLSPPPSLPLTSTEGSSDVFFSAISQEVFSKGVIYLFAFNVGQGNFILLRHAETAILVDAGSKDKDDLRSSKLEERVKACLEGAKIEAVIITHTDDDHYNYLGEDWLKSFLRKGAPLYVGGTFEKAKKIIERLGVDSSQLHSRVPGQFWRNSSKTSALNEDIEKQLNAFIPECVFEFLSSPVELIHPDKTNPQSLVFLLTYGGRSILFTGDATGETLDCCLHGETPLPPNVIKNRAMMKKVNVLMVPHHGSETDGSWRWTYYVLKHSKKFLGAIISVDPHTSSYGHAHNWIRELRFPDSARGDKVFRIGYSIKAEQGGGRGTRLLKEKITSNRIYMTGMLSMGVCLRFESNGNISELTDLGWVKFSSKVPAAEDTVRVDASDDDEKAESQPDQKRLKTWLASLGEYEIHNVLGDGNCGIYAILQGANPSVLARFGITSGLDYNFSIPLGASREDFPQWQNAKKLREALFEEEHPKREMALGLSGETLSAKELENSDLAYIAQKLRQNILLFTEGTQNIEYFCTDGSVQILENVSSLPDWKTCICLYYRDNHFQTIIPKTK